MKRLKLCKASAGSGKTYQLALNYITLLLGERREVIYNRRLRLRARIREVAPTHMEIFLNYLR